MLGALGALGALCALGALRLVHVFLGEKSHEIQTLHDELDELDGYLSESEGFDDDT